MQHTKQNRVGFTFIEMIIVVSMVGVISLAVYAMLNNGLKIWQKVNQALPQEDLAIFFDHFATDLKNTCLFKEIKFIGNKERVEFPLLVNSLQLEKKTIGKVAYIYEEHQGLLLRRESDYSQVYLDRDTSSQPVIKNIKSLKFQYYFLDTEHNEYSWQDEWRAEGLPLAVRIELELENGTEINKYTKTVSIPVGS